jgi:hypothetical protein
MEEEREKISSSAIPHCSYTYLCMKNSDPLQYTLILVLMGMPQNDIITPLYDEQIGEVVTTAK